MGYVFDSKYIYENSDFKKIKYLNSNYTEVIDSLEKFINDVSELLKSKNNNIRAIKDVKEKLCVVIGFDKFLNSLSSEDKDKFTNILTKVKDNLKIHFMFIDVPAGFKPYEYEMWYKGAVNQSSGLWIGDGFAEQYLIKPTKITQDYYKVIGNSYGYLTEEGQVKVIKVIEKM